MCSSSCGMGNQKRSRRCENPKPAHGGDQCIGDAVEVKDCKLRECPGIVFSTQHCSLGATFIF